MSRVFFTADLHLGHKNIVKWRDQFANVDDHDHIIVENILHSVSKNDTLWILGDTCLSKDKLDMILLIRENVKKLNLILGNHDAERGGITLQDLTARADYVHALTKYKEAWLSHAPLHESELRGRWNIHGHTHNISVPHPDYFCVSVDQTDFYPIEFDKIKEKMEERRHGELD